MGALNIWTNSGNRERERVNDAFGVWQETLSDGVSVDVVISRLVWHHGGMLNQGI